MVIWYSNEVGHLPERRGGISVQPPFWDVSALGTVGPVWAVHSTATAYIFLMPRQTRLRETLKASQEKKVESR
jgi:hypothetical protein